MTRPRPEAYPIIMDGNNITKRGLPRAQTPELTMRVGEKERQNEREQSVCESAH